MANILGRKGLYDKAIEEYKLAIASPYKDTSSYANALDSLSSIYKGIKDEKRSSLYREAYDEYFRRRKNGDVHLSRNGINDFLIAKGEELK